MVWIWCVWIGMRVLVLTLPPFAGGVPYKAKQLCTFLRGRGHDVTVAYYATFHDHPELNRSILKFNGLGSPGIASDRCFDDFSSKVVGCWFPELEATYTVPSQRWRSLIHSHDRHIAVGGTALIAHPLVAEKVPFLLWCASDVIGDRRDRQAQFPLLRRWFDQGMILPWLKSIERKILTSQGEIRAVSQSAVHSLIQQGCPTGQIARLSIPVDQIRLQPPANPPKPGMIGFTGRFNDPRKNIGFLIQMMSLAKARNMPLELHLAGDVPSETLVSYVRGAGLMDCIHFAGELTREQLNDFYKRLDVFVIPSFQEGFCISGIEAMSCGVPVVSTRCGGPEDYVVQGATGYLVDTPEQMANYCSELAGNRGTRNSFAEAALQLAQTNHSLSAFESGLNQTWIKIWGETP